ncbi:MAG: endolytic transglycosylase MltG [Ruminococcus sp.]|jgi:UPF0755 protein|nr:endolytic transglycosylase MltG [Ruminococcus sp.]
MSKWNEMLNSFLKKKETPEEQTAEVPEIPEATINTETIELSSETVQPNSNDADLSEEAEDLTVVETEEANKTALNDEKKAVYEALLKNMDEIEKAEETDEENPSETEFEDDLTTYKRRRRNKRTVGHLIFSISVTALIVSAAFLCAGFLINSGKEIMGIGKPDTEIVIEVPETASMSRIADIFIDEGIIADRDLFLFFSRVRGLETIVPGAHEFSANMTYGEIADELQSLAITEEREAVDITFPEGITLFEAGQILEAADICDENDFIRTFNTETFGFDFESHIKNSTLKFYKMEGYCFPDTYRFYSDEDVESIVKKIYRNFNSKITPDYYQRMEDLEITLDETITFASIVQAEAGNVRDMKNVASVFWNRLNNDDEFPLLQSDPTTKYVNNVIMPNIDIQADDMFNAYDTYEGAGLPPGAICNPGLDAISAVLYPSETDYYFFCANIDTGEVYYAETLAEHEENLVIAGLAG